MYRIIRLHNFAMVLPPVGARKKVLVWSNGRHAATRATPNLGSDDHLREVARHRVRIFSSYGAQLAFVNARTLDF